jgi:hypothetical protein
MLERALAFALILTTPIWATTEGSAARGFNLCDATRPRAREGRFGWHDDRFARL